MVITERVTTGLSGFGIEEALGENATNGLDPHHCGSGAAVLDRRSHVETSIGPVVDVALAGDVVGRDTVMGQVDHGILFETEHHQGRYTFYNEVEAMKVTSVPP